MTAIWVANQIQPVARQGHNTTHSWLGLSQPQALVRQRTVSSSTPHTHLSSHLCFFNDLVLHHLCQSCCPVFTGPVIPPALPSCASWPYNGKGSLLVLADIRHLIPATADEARCMYLVQIVCPLLLKSDRASKCRAERPTGTARPISTEWQGQQAQGKTD